MGNLSELLISLGGPALAKVIGAKFGDGAGELARQALDALGQVFDVAPEPEALEHKIREIAVSEPAKAQEAVSYAEADFAPRLLAYAEVLKAGNEQQRLTNEQLQKQAEATGWRSDWLPAWQWFLMAIWGWRIFVGPIFNGVLRAVTGNLDAVYIELIDLAIMVTLTGMFLGLHMGGHTVLELMRGGALGKGEKR